MQDRQERERSKIDGRAAFAAAAYLIGVGLIYVLARVGAPDRLVSALGPLFALGGLSLLGVLTRSTRVPAFFAADRAAPAPYAGLAFAAIAAGLVLCLGPPRDSPLPLAGVAFGMCIGALATGPLLRATGASAPGDLLATRFTSRPLTQVLAALLLGIGALVASAGFITATNALTAQFQLSRASAAAVIALIAALTIAPGGLAGLVWGAAASAAVTLFVLYLPIARQIFAGGAALWSFARADSLGTALGRAWSVDPGNFEAGLLVLIATALGIAALPPFTAPAAASPSGRQALRAGGLGLVFAGLIGAAACVALIVDTGTLTGTMSGLRFAGSGLCAMTLAVAGVQSASRAWGLTNWRAADRRFPPLASQRLARSRAIALGVIAFCAALADRPILEPQWALVAAAAAALGLIAPVLALALFSRATSIHAIASLSASLATALVLGAIEDRVPNAGRLLIGALSAAAAGFAAGWSMAIFSPGGRRRTAPLNDLFIDAPLDPPA